MNDGGYLFHPFIEKTLIISSFIWTKATVLPPQIQQKNKSYTGIRYVPFEDLLIKPFDESHMEIWLVKAKRKQDAVQKH